MTLPLLEPANARVISVAGKRCRLELEDGSRVDAIARGRVYSMEDGGLVTGDLVIAEDHPEYWMVEEVLPRACEFVREGLRKDRQVMFANVDRVLILASLSHPQTKTATIDRFLVAALNGGIPVTLVLTKTDLDEEHARESAVRANYEAFDLSVFPVSNATGAGTDALASELEHGITALVGNSGVGKSSLLNRIIPGLDLRVREVSSWTGKGVHTTTASFLIPYGKHASLVDTPGMKSFTPYGITRDRLADLFPDIAALASECRFRDCRHVSEPNCAVIQASESGELPPARLRSYQRLIAELI